MLQDGKRTFFSLLPHMLYCLVDCCSLERRPHHVGPFVNWPLRQRQKHVNPS